MSALLSLSQNPWKRVVSVAEGASVFLDDAAGEILHWSEEEDLENSLIKVSLGVYSLYTDLNPIAKDFIAQAPYCHVVIVSTKPLIGRCAERIAALLSDIHPLECHVFCSLSESMHEMYTPLKEGVANDDEGDENGYSHYGEFQAMMKKWIKRESGVRVTVSYIDLFHTEILPNLFCTPVYHDSLFSLIPSDIHQLQQSAAEDTTAVHSLYDIQFNNLPDNFQKTVHSFVQSFDSFLSSLNLNEDIFSIGPTAGLLAEQLCIHEEAKSRRKIASKRCSVLFIDRSLDLATPSSRSSDYFTDRLFAQLPPLHNNSNDVAINMGPLSEADTRYLVPGCIAHPGNLRAKVILNSLTFSKQKEALMELSRNLVETLSKEKISARSAMKMGKPSSSQVKSFIEQFKNNPNTVMKHNQLLQFACGVIEVMEQNISKEWDLLCKDEQRVLQCLLNGDNGPSVVKFIITLVDSQLNNSDSSPERILPLSDVLVLVVKFYSLVGEECYTHHVEETNLKKSLQELIMVRRKCDDDFLTNIGFLSSWSVLQIQQKLDDVFEWLNSLGIAREHFTQFKDIFTPETNSTISSFVIQVLESICDPSRPELTDIKHHSQGISNILRSGFSLFMSSARPRPDNHPLLIVYIVGGVSINEVRALKEFRKPNLEIYMGANKILTPNRIVNDLLINRTLK